MDEIGKIENGENGRNGENRESGKTGNGEIWHIEDIARLTGRSVKRIRCMRSLTPENLPPAFTLPGSQLLCWLPDQVRAWIREHAAAQGACTGPHRTAKAPSTGQPVGRPRKNVQTVKNSGDFSNKKGFAS